MTKLLILISFMFAFQSFAKEFCTDPSTTLQVVIETKNDGRVTSIELYKNNKLIIKDKGESNDGFHRNICHLSGATYVGKIFIYGGCGTSENQAKKALTFKNSNESYDLNEFSCYTE